MFWALPVEMVFVPQSPIDDKSILAIFKIAATETNQNYVCGTESIRMFGKSKAQLETGESGK